MSQPKNDSFPLPSEEVRAWLEQAGLEQYYDVFLKENIEVESLKYMEESHLKELGLSIGDRIKFKRTLEARIQNTNSPTIGPSESRLSISSPDLVTKSISVPNRATGKITENISISLPSPSSLNESEREALSTNNNSLKETKKKTNSSSSIQRTPSSLNSPKQTPVEMEEYQCKVVVIGPGCAGKTSLVRRFVNGKWERGYKQTIGVDFEVKTINFSENIQIHIQLWDIAGQERFNTVVPQFYRSAAAALVVFDVSDEGSLQSALRWNEHLQKHEIKKSGKNIPVLLLANKSDLLTENKPVYLQDMDKLCETHQFLKWWLTSAKENKGIDEAINFLIKTLLSENGIDSAELKPRNTVKIDANTKSTQKSGCCL